MQNKEQKNSTGTSASMDTKPLVSGCFRVGQKIPMISGGYLKIMAYADGYYMARFKGCIPFCCRQDELIRRMLSGNSR